MNDWSPLEEDVLLKGSLSVRVVGKDRLPQPKRRVVRGCGFV